MHDTKTSLNRQGTTLCPAGRRNRERHDGVYPVVERSAHYGSGRRSAFQEEMMPVATVNTGDTAWVLVSAALVLLMTPGLAFFYGGLVRRKNMLSVLMQCFMMIGLVTLQWVVVGYRLAFGPSHAGWIGG